MRLGDVFKAGQDDELYQVLGVDIFGRVLARRFELEHGEVGAQVEFEPGPGCRVLFNAYDSVEIERGCEVCEMTYQVEFSERGDWSGELWFEAVSLQGDGSQTALMTSPRAAFTRGNNWPNPEIPDNHKVHQQLCQMLEAAGWQLILERRSWWWKCRFKRPCGEGR
ncbi:hypothetical protein ADN00_01990 [Ornatilinea apprima]|uniref:Uncharacterized protein n=1 Tax=Ornatilinea apprima TaxID=1134406 RepID=A0A0N8GP69_9CHLR|nr:hypothetical protein [Ornatilinea apprima]KPL80066.1 hypothetical protein ADN00_01990 [Ornatilinea apprima]